MQIINFENPFKWKLGLTEKLLHPLVLKNCGIKFIQVMAALYCAEKYKIPVSLATFVVSIYINKEILEYHLEKSIFKIILLSRLEYNGLQTSPLKNWDMFASM